MQRLAGESHPARRSAQARRPRAVACARRTPDRRRWDSPRARGARGSGACARSRAARARACARESAFRCDSASRLRGRRRAPPSSCAACDGARWARRSCRRRSSCPRHTARYSRSISCAASAATSAVCAASVRATTNNPLVSLSMRCTRPARGTRARCASCASSAFCSVCSRLPAPGCTTTPGALLITMTAASWWTISSGSFSGRTVVSASMRASTVAVSPPTTTSRARTAGRPLTRTAPASIQRWIRVREYSGRSAASAASRRRPANSAGNSRRWVWNLEGNLLVRWLYGAAILHASGDHFKSKDTGQVRETANLSCDYCVAPLCRHSYLCLLGSSP